MNPAAPILASTIELLDQLADDAWAWFDRNTHGETGLTLDRAPNASGVHDRKVSSLGGSGFYLALLPVAIERDQLSESDAETRAFRTLSTVAERVEHVNGLVRHFVDWQTASQVWDSEYSVLDTALLLHGSLVAAERFGGRCRSLTSQLCDRIHWDQLRIRHPRLNRDVLAYQYDGKTRKLRMDCADVRSAENLMPCLLACGSSKHSIGSWCWQNMELVKDFKPLPDWKIPDNVAGVLNAHHGLFTSYYGLCWADLAGLHDPDGVDLCANARKAAFLNRSVCRDVHAKFFSSYSEANGGWWGLSAGDSPAGYVAPDPLKGDADGTVWPTAALGAFQWIPEELAGDVVRWQQSKWWPRCRGRYGLAPFSIDRKWFGGDIISIDIGSFAVNWWNWRKGAIYQYWMSHPVAKAGLSRLEFSRV